MYETGTRVLEGIVASNWWKTVVFWLLALIPLVVVLEIASYFMITKSVPTRIRSRHGRGSIEAHLREMQTAPSQLPQIINNPKVHDKRQQSYGTRGRLLFHPVLGWDYPPNLIYNDPNNVLYTHGPWGERLTCTSFPETLISTYGDSFVYCMRVSDDQTWQTYLAQIIGSNVLNFGVGGYGTDQACLKYLERGHSVSTPIVFLCIFPENINRVVNIFRPFYCHEEQASLTKPIFVKTADGFQLVPNPLKDVEDIAKLRDPAFLKELGKLDYWYQLDQELPEFSAPYILSLYSWRKSILDELLISLGRIVPSLSGRYYSWNLYDEPGPLSIMCHIVDVFVEAARSRGSLPMIVMIPHKDCILELMDNGVGRYENLLKHIRQKNYPYIDAIKAVAEMKPPRSQLEKWYDDHARTDGNKLLADIIGGHLIRNYPTFVHGARPRSTPDFANSDSR